MRARLFAALAVAVGLLGGACILGPKQDDPAADYGNADATVDSGSSADTSLSLDTGKGNADAALDTKPTIDSPATDTATDAVPPGDAPDGGALDGDAPDGDDAGDASVDATDAGAPG